jgi:S-DNA-T family DNA segregation ATPase FtsK/SpoIIIE
MARKRRSSRKQEKKQFSYGIDITAFILILLGFVGLGSFGKVGTIIKKAAMFLLGDWWFVILLVILVVGSYMLIKRKAPNFFTPKLIGFYLALTVILLGAHFSFINQYAPREIINVTWDNCVSRTNSMGDTSNILSNGQTGIKIGGGITGAGLSAALKSLFGKPGTIVVMILLSLIAIILLFDINLGDEFTKVKEKMDERRRELEEEEDEEDEEEEEEPVHITDGRNTHEVSPVTISSEIKSNEQPMTPPQPVATPRGFYKLPSINILDEIPKGNKNLSNDFTKSNKIILERVLSDFDIKGTVVEIHVGPAVTQYEVAVSSGTKLSRIVTIDKEIALALAAKSVSIEAPIPGKSTVGIEIPNPSISAVKFKEILGFIPKEQEKGKIVVALGKDLMGRVQTMDITKTPHLLIAGATGSGKSVCMNSIIASILMRYRPDEVKMVLVDPKKVEMSNYNGIPHLLWPVVNDPKKASVALQRVVAMMDERYDLFAEAGVKKIEEYNEYVDKHKDSDSSLQRLPYLVVIIDELADLMIVAAKEVEGSIQRITQLARAAGIHLIVATQRPSTNVITGVIKANIPSRIAFAVTSFVDSRTILDAAGAEKLLGKGDMLYLPMGQNTPTRIQGCFITDDEIRRIIEHVCGQQSAVYDETLNQAIESEHDPSSGSGPGGTDDDPLYNEIYEFACETGKISASLIQRRFRLGYNRAARIIDILEERGVIGPQNGSKPREVLVGKNGGNSQE